MRLNCVGAADVGAGHVDRAERALVEAAHRAQAAAVEVLEDRERPAAQALALADLAVERRG